MPAASYNELFGLGSHSPDANLETWHPCMDNAASTTVLDYSGNGRHATLNGGSNTADIATTGPNSWLSSSFAFGNPHYLSLSLGVFPTTVLARLNPDSVSGDRDHQVWLSTNSYKMYLSLGSSALQWFTASSWGAGGSPSAATWQHLACVHGSDAYINATSAGFSKPAGTTPSSFNIGKRFDGLTADPWYDGDMCDVSLWSRALTAGEVAQANDGPEPIVVSGSDAVSGTEQVGQTLSASGATWGLDLPFSAGSNGTITYTYQWTRSDDGTGTNEADISGATSSTYTLQEADVGKYIRRRRRGTNDGGYDSAADHNSTFTGAIASAGSLLTTMLQHNHFAGGTAA